MGEAGNMKSLKYSEDLETPMELPPVESWLKDNCKFMERGKVLTKISNETCCFQPFRTTTWHLCYVIRTSDDALIIFTAPEKGFVLNLSSAIYLKIARNETSKGKRMCKVKLKWRFGKVKLKFAENQILIWRQRFLSTFGRIGDPNRNVTAIILKNQSDKAFNSKKTKLEEEWDTTDSVTSLSASYTLHSHSSQSSESLKNMESIPLFSDTEKTAAAVRLPPNIKVNEFPPSDTSHQKLNAKSPLSAFRKKQLCNCRRLLGLINRNDSQQQRKSKVKLKNKSKKGTSAKSKNYSKDTLENYDFSQAGNTNIATGTTQLRERNSCTSKTNSAISSTSKLALPEPSESNA